MDTAAFSDELYQPLGFRPDATRPTPRRRPRAFTALAAFVAAAAVAGQASFVATGELKTGDALAQIPSAQASSAQALASAASPPSRPAESAPAPAGPPTLDKAEARLARPSLTRTGAPEPLIIDVQAALAAQARAVGRAPR